MTSILKPTREAASVAEAATKGSTAPAGSGGGGHPSDQRAVGLDDLSPAERGRLADLLEAELARL